MSHKIKLHTGANIYAGRSPEGKKLLHKRAFNYYEDCPRCGKFMIVRQITGHNGQINRFIGCTQYPKCHFTATEEYKPSYYEKKEVAQIKSTPYNKDS